MRVEACPGQLQVSLRLRRLYRIFFFTAELFFTPFTLLLNVSIPHLRCSALLSPFFLCTALQPLSLLLSGSRAFTACTTSSLATASLISPLLPFTQRLRLRRRIHRATRYTVGLQHRFSQLPGVVCHPAASKSMRCPIFFPFSFFTRSSQLVAPVHHRWQS